MSGIYKTKSTTFWRLDLSPSSDGWGRIDLLNHSIQWLRLALSNGPNWVGLSSLQNVVVFCLIYARWWIESKIGLIVLSTFTHEATWKVLDGFLWNFILESLRKIVKPFQFSFRSAMYDDFTWISTCVSAHIALNIYPREKCFEWCCRKKLTYIIYPVQFICKSYSFRGCVYSFEHSHSTVNCGLYNTATIKKKHAKGSFCSV